MLREFRADLHIHTSLSPCGDAKMVPPDLVDQAEKKFLDIIGICDHNASENVEAVKDAGKGHVVFILGGMEITSSEEVHVLALFEDGEHLYRMQELIYENLPGKNDVRKFGEQLVVDAAGKFVGSNGRLLIGATNLSVREVVDHIHGLGGIAIASHIDKQMFSVVSQLGFVPENIPFDALEVSPHHAMGGKDVQTGPVDCGKLNAPIVSFSDAHYLEDIGKSFTCFIIEEASFEEVKKALHSTDGRSTRVPMDLETRGM